MQNERSNKPSSECLEFDHDRLVACLKFCQGVPSEELNCGLGVFVQAKLEYRQRLITPEIAEAIKTLKKAQL